MPKSTEELASRDLLVFEDRLVEDARAAEESSTLGGMDERKTRLGGSSRMELAAQFQRPGLETLHQRDPGRGAAPGSVRRCSRKSEIQRAGFRVHLQRPLVYQLLAPG